MARFYPSLPNPEQIDLPRNLRCHPMPIIQYPDPCLTTPTTSVTSFDAALHDLVLRLTHELYLRPAVGLAAPQLGVALSVAVIDAGRSPLTLFRDADSGPGDNVTVLINPVVREVCGREEEGWEGCLSLQAVGSFRVRRYTRVLVESKSVDGEGLCRWFGDFEARVVQHEIDHLAGVLISERGASCVGSCCVV